MTKARYGGSPLRVPGRRRQISLRLSQDLIDYAEREAYLRSARPPYDEVTLSDVMRMALEHFRATAAAVLPDAPKPCATVVAGDMTFCSTCGLRWDTNDSSPPGCPR